MVATILYNVKHKEVLDSFLLKIPIVRPGKMFGYPAYYVGNKLFACIYGDVVGVKVPESLAHTLLQQRDITYFQPMGRRKMREWIQIQRDSSDNYRKDKEIFEASIRYAISLANSGSHKG